MKTFWVICCWKFHCTSYDQPLVYRGNLSFPQALGAKEPMLENQPSIPTYHLQTLCEILQKAFVQCCETSCRWHPSNPLLPPPPHSTHKERGGGGGRKKKRNKSRKLVLSSERGVHVEVSCACSMVKRVLWRRGLDIGGRKVPPMRALFCQGQRSCWGCCSSVCSMDEGK